MAQRFQFDDSRATEATSGIEKKLESGEEIGWSIGNIAQHRTQNCFIQEVLLRVSFLEMKKIKKTSKSALEVETHSIERSN